MQKAYTVYRELEDENIGVDDQQLKAGFAAKYKRMVMQYPGQCTTYHFAQYSYTGHSLTV